MKTDEPFDFEILLRRFRDDPELRARMRAEPAGALEEQGFRLSPATDVRVVEDTAEVCHFVLPHAPNASLSDAAMEAVSGGSGHHHEAGIGGIGGPPAPGAHPLGHRYGLFMDSEGNIRH